MTLEAFKQSVREDAAPAKGMHPALQALWHDGRGDWTAAHELAQASKDTEGAWVHAYLHRKEGDEGNASYWYGRAGRHKPAVPLEEEWESIASELLGGR